MKEKIIIYLKSMKREQVIVYVLLLVLLLVVLLPVKKKDSSGEKTAKTKAEETEGSAKATQVEEMEQQLSNALSKVEGVGEVQVVITLESTNQKVVEKDKPSSQSTENQAEENGKNTTSSSSSSEESTVYEKDASGGETPYVVAENFPEIRGVLVIAKGGGNPMVVQQISEGVMALFRVEAHKIKVMKMK